MDTREDRIKDQAHRLGFELVGIAAASPADGFERLRTWLESGFAGAMSYMHRHAEARRDPTSILPEVRSVVMVGMNYGEQKSAIRNPQSAIRRHARVARYAQGSDYHEVLRLNLRQLLAWIQEEVPDCRGRGVVDTAPLLERDYARRAGLGWFGKNTMLINKRNGSYFFLGALLLNIELNPDPPHEASHCGTCTACLDACPTRAFPEPGWLDARRCISYLTIELRGPIVPELRPGLGDWIFGCDVCQEVCPWNRKAPPGQEPALHARPELETLDPVEVLGLSDEEFRRRFRGTALLRAQRRGLARTAAIILGNGGDASALPALRKALHDPDPAVREAAQWALEQIAATQSEQRGRADSIAASSSATPPAAPGESR